MAHRDYTSAASVQVMIFSDRLEIWNPGRLPAALSLDALRRPHASLPGNPLIAEPLFVAKYIEKAGTGTLDMIERCREQGLPEPRFRLQEDSFILMLRRPGSTPQVTPQVTLQVTRLLSMMDGDSLREELQVRLKLADRKHFRTDYLHPALDAGLIEMTIPDKPRSSKQRYRLTDKGRAWLK